MAIGDVYDRGAKELDKNKYVKPISQYMRNKKGSNIKNLTGYTGLGLKLSGDGRKHGKGSENGGWRVRNVWWFYE